MRREEVPPFAPDPVDRPGHLWRFEQQGTYVNYVGLGSTDYLLLFIEPDAPVPNPPPVDEQHHTLSDGTAIHVSIWMRPGGKPVDHVISFPAAEGWVQIVAKPLDPTL